MGTDYRTTAKAQGDDVGPGEVSSALLGTARVVWPGTDRTAIVRTGRPARGARDYVVLPSASSPRWLLPAGAPHTAGALEGQGSGPTRRLAARGLALAHRTGIIHRLPLRRLRVLDSEENSLVGLLREALGDVDVAVRLAAWDHARGLVVRIFDTTGGTVAFGRMGIDDHGEAAVRAERHGLERAAGLCLRSVVLPAVLGSHDWRGRDVLLVTPLTPFGRQPPASEIPVTAMLELANAGGARTASLLGSGWWSSVLDRIAGVEVTRLRAELDSARRALESAGEVHVPLGAWHGDWTPWNMAWRGPRVLLWDWEHFAEDVPVGFDLLHHAAQHARVSQGTDVATERAWRTLADALLREHVGLAGADADLVVLAYLLEVNLRYVLDRQGTSASEAVRLGWGLDLLRHEVRRLAGR